MICFVNLKQDLFVAVCPLEKIEDAGIELLSGPNEFFEGAPLKLRCSVRKGTYVSYSWWVNGQLVSPSPPHDYLYINRSVKSQNLMLRCIHNRLLYSCTLSILHFGSPFRPNVTKDVRNVATST